ncbi:MAG: hypothetical protein ABSB91_00315 [Sedimentisphaerales bacterium]|jgi:hypothetical protein
MSDPEATIYKQILLFVLDCLNRVYPSPLQVRTLYRVVIGLFNNYSKSLMNKDIAFLKQKGYIEYVDSKIDSDPEFMDKCVGLTAKGKEIAMRIQTDPALEI